MHFVQCALFFHNMNLYMTMKCFVVHFLLFEIIEIILLEALGLQLLLCWSLFSPPM